MFGFVLSLSLRYPIYKHLKCAPWGFIVSRQKGIFASRVTDQHTFSESSRCNKYSVPFLAHKTFTTLTFLPTLNPALFTYVYICSCAASVGALLWFLARYGPL